MIITTVTVDRDMNKASYLFWHKLKIKLDCLAEMNDWPVPFYARLDRVSKTDVDGIVEATFIIHDSKGDEA